MTNSFDRLATLPPKPDRRVIVTALGVTQIFAWGSTFYLLGVLALPVAKDTGWALDWVMGGVSIGLLVAGLILVPASSADGIMVFLIKPSDPGVTVEPQALTDGSPAGRRID